MQARPDRLSPDTPPLQAPEICLEKVEFGFGGSSPLFKDFDCTLAAGKWTCLLGPSGCGKSTLLRLISGSLEPTGPGRILFDGQAPEKGLVSWMAQKDLLLPWLTVLGNVMLGATLRGTATAEKRRRAFRLLQETGLGHCCHALPDSLSGGMRQRVALLRTLMEGRPVILMDEPFSALDALTRLKLQDLAAGLVRGATVLLVTHDPWEALRLGHQIYVMNGHPAHLGRLFRPGGEPPREAVDEENGKRVADLLKELSKSKLESRM